MAGKIIRILQFIGWAMVILCTPIALWIAHRLIPLNLREPVPPTHTELVSILLTGLTISMAALAVVIGLLAIWGYHAIKDESHLVATNVVERMFQEYIRGDEIEKMVRGVIAPIAEEEARKLFEELSFRLLSPV